MIYDIAVSLVIGLYLLVAIFAFFATTSEQQHNGVRALGPRLIGVLSCVFWPFVVCAMLLLQRKTASR